MRLEQPAHKDIIHARDVQLYQNCSPLKRPKNEDQSNLSTYLLAGVSHWPSRENTCSFFNT
jgi:hypothetical protein